MTSRNATLLVLCALVAACDRGAPPSGADEVFVVAHDFLTDASQRVVELERPDAPVVARTVGPRATAHRARAMLPALSAAPPARIVLEIPDGLAEGARLELAAGFDASAYKAPAGGARVHFRVSFDGRPRAETTLPFGAEIRRDQRVWNESRFPLRGARRVTLETSIEGEREAPVDAAWGLLQISVPQRIERSAPSVEHPNLVLVVIDTLRADRLGCYGYARPTSPRIDALAARGTRFDRAYSTAPWTWPSTASILTSLEPPAHGFDSPDSCFLAQELESLPEPLLRAGFHTAAFSSNPLVSSSHNFHQGFERFSEFGLVPAEAVMPDVLAWLRHKAGERFFLYLHIADPHGPYKPDPAIAGELLEPPPEGAARGVCSKLFERRARGEAIDESLLARLVAYNSSLYDGEVRVSDFALGQLVDEIERLGLSDRTVFAITSDHGEEFLDHGYAGHAKQLYDELVHVPLVLAGPGVPAGAVEERSVQNRFLPQTLLHLARVEGGRFPEATRLFDPDALDRLAAEPLFTSTRIARWLDARGKDLGEIGALYGMRQGGRSFQWAPRGAGPEDDLVRYYELDADPEMRHDLSAEHPELIEPFESAIRAWLAGRSAQCPGSLHGGAGTLEMLRGLGYVEDEGEGEDESESEDD